MKVTKIRKDDILLCKVDIGNLPPQRANEYLERIKTSIKIHFDNKILLLGVTPSDSGSRGTTIEILRKEK
jgi:hypothetical protein